MFIWVFAVVMLFSLILWEGGMVNIAPGRWCTLWQPGGMNFERNGQMQDLDNIMVGML